MRQFEDGIIDPQDLVPGAEISRAECERILGTSFEHDRKYGIHLMNLAGYVMRLIRKSGNLYTVRTQQGGIQVLTHSEAAAYNADEFDRAMRHMRRCHRRLNAVDVSELTQEELKSYGKARDQQSRVLSAVRTAYGKPIELTPYVSTRPGAVVRIRKPQGKE